MGNNLIILVFLYDFIIQNLVCSKSSDDHNLEKAAPISKWDVVFNIILKEKL